MAQVAQLVGFDVARGNWATTNATLGPGATHRIFYSGALPATFDGDGTPTNVTCIVSYKTQNTNVAAYVKSIPQNRSVILIYHHEPEGDYTLGSTFVSEFKSQSDLIRAQGRTNVKVAMCSAGYPYRNAGTADVLNGNYLKGLGPYVDMFTKDIYQGTAGVGGFDWPSSGLSNYPQWTNWLNLVTNTAIVGQERPLGITEYGVSSNVGDSARNTRISADGTYLTNAFTPGGASAVSSFPLQMWCYWYQSIDVNNDLFTDSATITLWKGYETAAPAATGAYLIGQNNAAGGSNTLVVSVSTATNKGDVVVVNTDCSSGTVSGVADSKGNAYTQRNSDTGAVGTNLYQFSADGSNNTGGTTALTTADTITITFSASAATKCAVAAGVSGMTSSPIDAGGTVSADSAGSAAPSATTGVLAQSGEVIIAAEGNGNGGGAISWSGSWTQLGTAQHNGSGQWLSVVFQVAPSTAAVTASGTITSSKWTVETLALKPQGAVTVAGVIDSRVDFGMDVATVLATPDITPPNVGGNTPSAAYPQIFIEAGLTVATPVAAAGTLVLDDPVKGKLDTARLGESTVWTDIAGFFRSGTIVRPSSRVQGPLRTYEGATASADLDNSDGRFDPDNLSGPYVIGGKTSIRPMIPLRVRAVYGPVEYHVFSGFADAWQEDEVDFDAGWSQVTVTASDGFKVLSNRNLADLGSAAGVNETADARINRILTSAGWYTDHRSLEAGISPLQGTMYGDSALGLMQLAADSEIGELYIDGSGNVIFRGRRALITDARSKTVQAVFGDSPGTVHAAGTELYFASIGRANDDTTLANDVQATIVNGTLQEVQDKASISKYLFPRSYSRDDLILTTDLDANGWAQYVLSISLNAENRIDSITIDPLADPANLFPQVLGREIGDRIQIWRRPQNSGITITKDMFIRGITHVLDVTENTWRTVWDLEDATKYTGFIILDDPSLGKLDSGNRLAY